MNDPLRRPRVLIVDDEPLARMALNDLLVADGRVDIIGEAINGREAVRLICRLTPDVVLLDIRMPGMDGFAVVAKLRESLAPKAMPEIVFVTAFDAFALRAFEAQALDYVLKPTDERRLAQTLDRVLARLGERRSTARTRTLLAAVSAAHHDIHAASSPGPADSRWLERIAVTSGNRVIFLKAGEIDWIEARSYYARIHVGPKSHLIRESMTTLAQRLDPARFARIHRSTIVNLDRIASLEPHDRRSMRVILRDGQRLTMSRRRRRLLSFLEP